MGCYPFAMVVRNPRFWLAVTAWWTLHGLILAIEGMTMRSAAGEPLRGFMHALAAGLVSAWLWIPLTAGLVALSERMPLEQRPLHRALLVHFVAVACVIVFRAIAVYVLNPFIDWYPQQPRLGTVLIASLVNNFLTAWLIVGVAHSLLFHRRSRERERQAIALEARLATARLQVLSNQLNPHFLFNALNSVAELVHHNPDAADRMLVALGKLLRESLDGSGKQEVPLREELSLLEQYVSLERLRLEDRLRLRWDVDPSLLSEPVPRLLLQPLVENAVHHAIGQRIEPGNVTVSIRRIDRRMLVEIRDDGAGLRPDSVEGIGLGNTRERLEALYGADCVLELLPAPGGIGTMARVVLPIGDRGMPR